MEKSRPSLRRKEDAASEAYGPFRLAGGKEKEKKKRKRRKFWRQFGANLLIGTVFLVIAVVMAVLKLQTLVLLFGVASILFLIFGLKKLFRKRRRKIRNPFQKNR